jgi:hypothetical protein
MPLSVNLGSVSYLILLTIKKERTITKGIIKEAYGS